VKLRKWRGANNHDDLISNKRALYLKAGSLIVRDLSGLTRLLDAINDRSEIIIRVHRTDLASNRHTWIDERITGRERKGLAPCIGWEVSFP
jgi:hypothetical protein